MTAPPPAWATSAEARTLLAAVRLEQPDFRDSGRLPSIYGGHREPTPRRYRGKNAAALRRLYDEWLQREFEAMDAVFAVTGHWPERHEHPLAVETADALIRRALEWPAVPYTPFEIVERDDGSARVAA